MDGDQAARTRTALLEEACETDMVLLPAHLRGAGMRAKRRKYGFSPIACGCDGKAIG